MNPNKMYELYEVVDVEYWRDEKGNIHSGLITLKKGDVIIKDLFLPLGRGAIIERMGIKRGDVIYGFIESEEVFVWKIEIKKKLFEYLGRFKYLFAGEIKDFYYETIDDNFFNLKIDCGGVNVWSCGIDIKYKEKYKLGEYILYLGRLDFFPKEEDK